MRKEARVKTQEKAPIHGRRRSGFTHIGEALGGVIGEIARRARLRETLEARLGRALSDSEFLEIAESTGSRI